jgi:hypothetical protein
MKDYISERLNRLAVTLFNTSWGLPYRISGELKIGPY